jgi:four helix bundle protein
MAPHERFEAWQYAHRVTLETYRLTRAWPVDERYGLSAQVRRCAYSVPANIVEGAAKRGRKEFARYLDISLGSHAELGYGIRLAEDLGYLSGESLENLKTLHASAGRLTRRLYEAVSGRGRKEGPSGS